MKSAWALGMLAVAGIAASASASAIVAPNAYAATPGGGTLNTLVRDANNPRHYQLLIDASQLGGIPLGNQITGLGWRLANYSGNATNWPVGQDPTWAIYNVTIGQAATTAATMSTTFANNITGGVLSSTGPLQVMRGSFVGGNTSTTMPPNPFYMMVTLATPYTYNGGGIVIDVAHGGSDITNNRFLDAIASATTQIANGVRGLSASSLTATTGALTSFTVTEITHAVPTPGALVLLTLGGLVGTRRRR